MANSNKIIITNKLSWIEKCVYEVNSKDWYKTFYDWGYEEIFNTKDSKIYIVKSKIINGGE